MERNICIQIAGINIDLNVSNRKWFDYLINRYSNFIKDRGKSDYVIYISPHRRRRQYHPYIYPNGKSAIIKCPLSLKTFLEFNFNFKLIFSRIALENEKLLLHASSFIKDGRSYVFYGPDRAGKSTIVRLASNYRSVSDDSVILGVEKNKLFSYSSPFIEKEKVYYQDRKDPVSTIYSLKKSKKNSIDKLSTQESTGSCYNNLYMYSNKLEDPGVLKDYLDLCCVQISKINVYRLEFNKTRDFIKLL